jgi:galactitol-specific phosphotransferase system IIB component
MVGKQYELFLNSLEKPLQVNEMRAMKESNYIKFR